MKTAILGAGSWGTTLTDLLAKKEIDVTLWGRSSDIIENINRNKENNRYLPGYKLHRQVKATCELKDAINGSELVVFAVPSHVFRQVVQHSRRFINDRCIVVSATKGFEPETNKRMSAVLEEELVNHKKVDIAILSGPNLYKEILEGYPTSTVISSSVREVAEKVQQLFMSPRFRPYINEDIIGVEVAGALKNIIAIASGIVNGLGFKDNTKATLMTRGLAEIRRMGVKLGANPHTFSGLAGIGDLIATCASPLSRNHQVGMMLAKGLTREQIEQKMVMVAEGIKTTKTVKNMAAELQVEMPITEAVYRVLYEGQSTVDALNQLMTRKAKPELEIYEVSDYLNI